VLTTQIPTERQSDDLADEVRRYLNVVEAFRAAGCEPRWRPETQRGEQDD
jgi:hypothetical protein